MANKFRGRRISLSRSAWPRPFRVEYVSLTPESCVLSLFLTRVSRDDMACIMDPPIDETCQRIGKHLSGLKIEVLLIMSRRRFRFLNFSSLLLFQGETLRCLA